ncbi:hypothetical protein [Hafnia sp.]|uniref:hypothetical protein n=1 Tax=Hafnia sp. TaxID=1873498 RepID=UPI002FC8C14A
MITSSSGYPALACCKATRSIDAPGRPRAGAPASMASKYDAATWASKWVPAGPLASVLVPRLLSPGGVC